MRYKFFNSSGEEGHLYSFSTDLEKIGLEWDVQIENGSFIEVISEPILIQRPKYGGIISVSKIRANVARDYHTIIKDFWIPTNCIVELQSNSSN
jgi:hypothetical protein